MKLAFPFLLAFPPVSSVIFDHPAFFLADVGIGGSLGLRMGIIGDLDVGIDVAVGRQLK